MKFKDIYNPHCLLYDFETSLMESKINENRTNKNDVIKYFKNFYNKTTKFYI